MDFFNQFRSNSCAGAANQLFFTPEKPVSTGRVFYKIFAGGSFDYSLLFSNTIDSTYSDGSICHCNLLGGTWEILEARVGKNPANMDTGEDVLNKPNECNAAVSGFVPLTFQGASRKTVEPGELFCCDPFPYTFEAGEFLCLEITYSGSQIPYHEESILPIYEKSGDSWGYNRKMPIACMVGCDRPVEKRIAYLGDSITQGIGTPVNAYTHWNALVSQSLGTENAYWNLGIGFGRANDMSTDGIWLKKAKQNDAVIVCAGVNDIYRGFSEEQLIRALDDIVELLTRENIKVILQTIPPFNYEGAYLTIWKNANRHIQTVLAEKVSHVFDNVPLLGFSEEAPQVAKYGGHPDETGCRIWADALSASLIENNII